MNTKQAIEIIETSLVADKHLNEQGLHCEPLIMAHEAALQALQEKEERENQKPLTLEELLAVNEEPVWIWFIDAPGRWVIRSSNCWVDISYPERMSLFNMKWYKHSAYGVDWVAYRYKPKEERKVFKVIDKTTGEVFTVYGLNGTHFLIYDAVNECWLYKNMDECRPCICGIDFGVEFMNLETARGCFE